MKFETWLKQQTERDDCIADLANDYIRCCSDILRKPFSNFIGSSELHTIEHCFTICNPCEEALIALDKARAEYNNSKKTYNKETIKAINEARNGKGIKKCKSVDDLFDELEVNECQK